MFAPLPGIFMPGYFQACRKHPGTQSREPRLASSTLSRKLNGGDRTTYWTRSWFDPLTFLNAVTSLDYRKVTREPFTELVTASILLIEGSSGGGLPGACDLRVGRRFLF
jgi:hypothetical protein